MRTGKLTKKVLDATRTSQANTGTFGNQAFGHIFRSTLGAFYVNLYAGQYSYLFFNAAAVPMYYTQARWYDPTTGTWLSRDPIGFNGGDWNLYRYAGNEPVGRMDPTGMVPPVGKSQCKLEVRSTFVALEDRLGAIANDLVPANPYVWWLTQSCFDSLDWNCDAASEGTGDTPEYQRTCCIRAGKCVQDYWQTPIDNAFNKWLTGATKACSSGSPLPPPPLFSNSCSGLGSLFKLQPTLDLGLLFCYYLPWICQKGQTHIGFQPYLGRAHIAL